MFGVSDIVMIMNEIHVLLSCRAPHNRRNISNLYTRVLFINIELFLRAYFPNNGFKLHFKRKRGNGAKLNSIICSIRKLNFYQR